MKLRFLASIFIIVIVGGCGSTSVTTSTVTADFRKQKGVYVIAYTADQIVRTRMELQLANDLAALDMFAIPSFEDIDDITSTKPEEVIAKANEKKLLGLLLINQVSADGSDSLVKNPKRISPSHPTLREFYSYTRGQVAEKYDADQEVFAEVNLFILDRGEAKLFWSGTTWSFRADNKGTAIRDMSDTIARQLAQVRDRYR